MGMCCFGGGLRKDKLNVVNVMFLVGQSFRISVEKFINVEDEFTSCSFREKGIRV
jgi:hypothetical protein